LSERPNFQYVIGILDRIGTGEKWNNSWQKQFKEEFRLSGFILENNTFYNLENEENGQILSKGYTKSRNKIMGQYCLTSAHYSISNSKWAEKYASDLKIKYLSGGFTRDVIGFFCFNTNSLIPLIKPICYSARGYLLYWLNNKAQYFSPIERRIVKLKTNYSKSKKAYTLVRLDPSEHKTGLLGPISYELGYSPYSDLILKSLMIGPSDAITKQTIRLWVLSYDVHFSKFFHQNILLEY